MRAAIYSRISLDPEGMALGVERQERDCRTLVAEQGLELIEIYRENDTSASTLTKRDRPVYERLLADVQRGRINVIAAYSTSRLTRRPLEYERLMALSESHGLVLKTVVSGAIDLETADGRALARIAAAMDAGEAERLSERVRRARRQSIESGQWVGAKPPYGYTVRRRQGTKKLAIQPLQANALRDIVTRLEQGTSLRGVAIDLARRDVRSATGRPWTVTSIRRTLQNPALAGLQLVEGRLVPGDWRPILPLDKWTLLRDQLSTTVGRVATYRAYSAGHPLAGLLFCSGCEHMLRSRDHRRSGAHFVCPPRHASSCGQTDIYVSTLPQKLLDLTVRRRTHWNAPTVPLMLPLQVMRIRELQADYYDNVLDHRAYLRQLARYETRWAEPEFSEASLEAGAARHSIAFDPVGHAVRDWIKCVFVSPKSSPSTGAAGEHEYRLSVAWLDGSETLLR
jgi:DNA invertase Pin-like site-specific DNA recombinase